LLVPLLKPVLVTFIRKISSHHKTIIVKDTGENRCIIHFFKQIKKII